MSETPLSNCIKNNLLLNEQFTRLQTEVEQWKSKHAAALHLVKSCEETITALTDEVELLRRDNRGLKIELENSRVFLDEHEALKLDKARLDWLIKQGPPGATDGPGLNGELWELGYCEVADYKRDSDNQCIRQAIDAATTATP